MTPGPPSAPPYVRVATSPRMLLLLAVFLVGAVVCGMLGAWQLGRAELRGAERAAEQAARQEAAPARPVADVLPLRAVVTAELVGTKVEVVGHVAGPELRVPGRVHDGRHGALVLTPVRVADGGLVTVVRGWVPDVTTPVEPLPDGEVRVVGWLRSGEDADGAPSEAGEVSRIAPAQLTNVWDAPVHTGYVVLAEVTPAQDPVLTPLGRPTGEGDGLNLQNLAYALQWWLFGAFAVLLWARIVRDEARDLVVPSGDAAAEGAGADPAAGPDPSPDPSGVGERR